jgi:hypothetical protein
MNVESFLRRNLRERMIPARLRDEEGSVLLLTIFSAILALAVILGVMAASSLYIERKRLFTVADGAATAAAEAFSLDSVSFVDGRPRIHLSDEQVDTEARQYLAVAGSTGSIPMNLVSAQSEDGRSATVTLAGQWYPPMVSLFFPQGIELTVSASARTVFG